jgi:hypothetical protein
MKSFNNVVDAAYQYIKQHQGNVSSEDAMRVATHGDHHTLSPKDMEEALDVIKQARMTYYPEKRA